MSRPLVIKVTSHNSQPCSKATGSIKVALLRGSITRSSEDTPVINSLQNHEETSGLVRNLVNKYELTTSPGLKKYKSKSLIDLSQQNKQKTQTNKTQDDNLFHKILIDDEVFEEWRQNYQQALSKFQNLPDKTVLTRNDKTDARDIRKKAQTLLEATKHDYFWFNEVIELLHQIANEHNHVFVNDFAKQSRSRSISAVSTSSQVDNEPIEINPVESSRKVSEIKQMYEEKVSQKPQLYSETSKDTYNRASIEKTMEELKLEQKQKVPLKYFGQQNEESDASTLTDTDDNLEGDHTDTNSHTPNTGQMSETGEPYDDDQHDSDCNPNENYFHAELDETSALHTSENKEALQTVEDMIRKIEECDRKIDNLSSENKIEANNLNDILIQVLIKLDDLKTHDDGVIVTMRRRAFGFTQDCIKKLKDKVFGDDQA